MSRPENDAGTPGRPQNTPSTAGSAASPTRPTAPPPPEPADVDALLADSLRAQSEQEFAWKEPERRPRWYERAEMEQTASAPSPADAPPTGTSATSPTRRRRRPGQVVVGLICLLLALWVLAGVVLGIVIDPLLVALGVCAVAGLALVAAGLRPKPGTRI